MRGERRDSQAGRTGVAVGLTGGIGAGKSTALALFSECGALVFSADELVHELYKRSDVASVIQEHFGSGVMTPQGLVDRTLVAEAVKGQTEELRWLEEVTHPLVAEEIEGRIASAPSGSVLVCEVPLLFETGFDRLFDLVVTIEADPEVRRQRSIHRFGLEQFSEFEGLQASRERRMAKSDQIFVNDGGLEQLRGFVSSVYDLARQMFDSERDKDRE